MKEETSNFPGMTRRANELEIFTFSYDPEGVAHFRPDGQWKWSPIERGLSILAHYMRSCRRYNS